MGVANSIRAIWMKNSFGNAWVTPAPRIQGRNMNKHLDKIWPQIAFENKANSTVLEPYFCSYVYLVCGVWGFKMIPHSLTVELQENLADSLCELKTLWCAIVSTKIPSKPGSWKALLLNLKSLQQPHFRALRRLDADWIEEVTTIQWEIAYTSPSPLLGQKVFLWGQGAGGGGLVFLAGIWYALLFFNTHTYPHP